MNITDQPAWPDHVSKGPAEIFVANVDGWDVWINPYEEGVWVNVNYGPDMSEWFCVQDGPIPPDTPDEVRGYLQSLVSLHQ